MQPEADANTSSLPRAGLLHPFWQSAAHTFNRVAPHSADSTFDESERRVHFFTQVVSFFLEPLRLREVRHDMYVLFGGFCKKKCDLVVEKKALRGPQQGLVLGLFRVRLGANFSNSCQSAASIPMLESGFGGLHKPPRMCSFREPIENHGRCAKGVAIVLGLPRLCVDHDSKRVPSIIWCSNLAANTPPLPHRIAFAQPTQPWRP